VKASTNKPGTWCDHVNAVKAVEAGLADGIGFMLRDSEIGAFDLDDCRDPVTGEIAPWAWTLIDEAQSYTEITVSGTGLRIIGRASGSTIHRKQQVPGTKGSIETYRRAIRYIVLTGLHLPGSYDDLTEIDQVMDRVVTRLDQKKQAEPKPFSLADLPDDLAQVIRDGVSNGERSEKFFHVVGWLKDLGFSISDIEQLFSEHPQGIAQKYEGRLRKQITECFSKTQDHPDRQNSSGHEPQQAPQRIPLEWHGDADEEEDRAWLIRDLIPETGKGLLSGQWGAGKTFGVLDLSASVMTMEPFAGRRVARQGGVLFIAPEGAYEIPIRLRGLVEGKLSGLPFLLVASGAKAVDLNRLPIAWIDECPPLVSKDAADILVLTAKAAAERLEREYGLPLALIVIDTVAASSGVTDENAAAENHRVMSTLETVSRQTGAFVLGVDHFGKAVETGTRGSSAKEAAADVVLAMFADRDPSGAISNTRMAVRKLRGGATGAETPYILEVVTLGENKHGEPNTTCIVQWHPECTTASPAATRAKWPDSLRVFKTAMGAALIDHGERRYPYGVV
jgi:DNA-binding transcriptional MerR regulator